MLQGDPENPPTRGGAIPCNHLLCALWAAVKDPVVRTQTSSHCSAVCG